ncbi:MAG: hypothetical protein COT15_03175 [Candidatus Diapherotrites archaeon CG08_land_8_20_14_0_20_34_12]|nr:MAG: hypothetical protein COT15_03175 [Candidatus Diapherotrites archaeon CG08_land_8_20_14_0_20_34_12]
MKIVRVILSPEAEEVYKYLNEKSANSKIEKSILLAINKKVELIKLNTHYGNPIGKDLIPKMYKEQYGITNLFRIELPNRWRMLYSLTNGGTEIEIIAFVLDIIGHGTYDKKFGYKKN